MTNESISNTANDQQSLVFNAHNEEPGNFCSSVKVNWKAKDTETPSNSAHDVFDLYSNLIGDIQRIKRYAGEILQHERSIIELKPNGSIVITPRPRQLPNEIVSLIMNHLSKQQNTLIECSVVSKQFHVIANPVLWKVVDFCDNDENNNNIRCERFLSMFSDASPQRLETLLQPIRDLYLDGPQWTDAQLTRLTPHIPFLNKLAIYSETYITDTGVQQLLQHCQRLTFIELYDKRLTQLSISAIAQHCRQLVDFDLHISKEQSPEWLTLLLPCPLERLHLTSYGQSLKKHHLTLIQQFDQLTCLKIEDDGNLAHIDFLLGAAPATTLRQPPLPPPLITEMTTPTTLLPLWPQLTTLDLWPCVNLVDPTIIAFIKSHPHLQELNLTHAHCLTDTSLDAMAASLPHLTYLKITHNANISVDAIRRLVRRCGRLQHLVLLACPYTSALHFTELRYAGYQEKYRLNPWAVEKIRTCQTKPQRQRK